MADTVENIDELIKYIESPEYLRMTARRTGDSAHSILAQNPDLNWQGEMEEDGEPEPIEPTQEFATGGVGPSAFGIQWNQEAQVCECAGCEERRSNRPARVRTPRTPRNADVVQLTTRSDWWEFAEVLSDRRPFKTRGALVGLTAPLTPRGGSLCTRSSTAYALFRADQNVIDYVVYSYRTPIAWHITLRNGATEWIFPDVTYSSTTTRHQTKIRTALNSLTENTRFIDGD